MNLNDLVKAVRILSDEQGEPAENITSHMNDAIAKINIKLKAEFPYLDSTQGDEEPVFPEKWQRALLIPFAVGRIKQMDSSQFEYTDAYNEFLASLDDMLTDYTVPDVYKDVNIGTSSSDIYTTPNVPWGWRW